MLLIAESWGERNCSCGLTLQAAENPAFTPHSVSGENQENKVTRAEKKGKITIMVKEYPNQAVHNAIAPHSGWMPSPSPCSGLPPPASFSRFIAWHGAMWCGHIPLDCMALLPPSFFCFVAKSASRRFWTISFSFPKTSAMLPHAVM